MMTKADWKLPLQAIMFVYILSRDIEGVASLQGVCVELEVLSCVDPRLVAGVTFVTFCDWLMMVTMKDELVLFRECYERDDEEDRLQVSWTGRKHIFIIKCFLHYLLFLYFPMNALMVKRGHCSAMYDRMYGTPLDAQHYALQARLEALMRL